MKKFEILLINYEQAEKDILQKVRDLDLDVKDIAKKIDATVSTTYSKLNGRSAILHHENLILADIIKFENKPLTNYEEYLTNLSSFIEENKIFKQVYFLSIIQKDNIGIKKRFKNPLLWKPEEVRAILIQLKKDLKQTPFEEIIVD
jgi:hypothetical protein